MQILILWSTVLIKLNKKEPRYNYVYNILHQKKTFDKWCHEALHNVFNWTSEALHMKSCRSLSISTVFTGTRPAYVFGLSTRLRQHYTWSNSKFNHMAVTWLQCISMMCACKKSTPQWAYDYLMKYHKVPWIHQKIGAKIVLRLIFVFIM